MSERSDEISVGNVRRPMIQRRSVERTCILIAGGGSEKSERSDEISVGVYLEPIYKPYRKIVSYLQGIISTESSSQNIVAVKIGRGQQSRKTKSGFQQKVMAQAICQDRNCIYGNGRLANSFLLRNKLETTFYPRSETSKTDKSPTDIWI